MSSAAPAASSLSALDAEEYLDRCGVTAYMKDVVTLLLENRPAQPIAFIAKYFKTVTQGSSPLLRAYRYIQLAPPSHTAFVDNLVAAYVALDARRGASHVSGAEVLRLLRLLCGDCPIDVAASLLRHLGHAESDPILFEDFSSIVRAGLKYETFFSRAASLFASCDPHGHGRVPRSVLQIALRQVGPHADAQRVAAALQLERTRDAKGDDGGAAPVPVASLPPAESRAELHRLQREVQNEVVKLGVPRAGGGAGGARDSPSSPLRSDSTVSYDEFAKALFEASISQGHAHGPA